MKQLNNDKGYALLISFVFILLLVIFISSFALRSTSNYKQIEQTDDTYELTSIAEMGVEYYYGAIEHTIAKYQDPINYREGKETQAIVNNLNSYIQERTSKRQEAEQSKIDEYVNASMIKLLGDIDKILEISCDHELYTQSAIETSPSECREEPENSNFYISSSEVGENNRTWKIEVTSFLASTKKTKTIETTINIPEAFKLIKPGENGSAVVNQTPSDFTSLVNPSRPIKNFVQNLPNYFKGNDYIATSMIENPNNAKIHAENNVSITGINNMTQLQILANNKVKFEYALPANSLTLYAGTAEFNNMEPLNSSNLEIEKSAIFQNLKMSGSTIQINNKDKSTTRIAQFGQINEMKNNSKIKINGNTKIESVISMQGESKIIIKGNLETGKIDLNDSTSSIDVSGALKVTAENIVINNGTIIVDRVEFPPNTNQAAIKIQNNGKICIRDINNLNALHNKRIFATSQGSIIYLDESLDSNVSRDLKAKDYPIIDSNDLTGSHNTVAGRNEFNKLCGISEAPVVIGENYEINNETLNYSQLKENILYH